MAIGLVLVLAAPAFPAPPRKTVVPKKVAAATGVTSATDTGGTQRDKGYWEPVNYGKDLELTDVYFVTSEVGYVSGAGGTILKTTDGGKTWTAQLGGEPESQDPLISSLKFVDETHGWAVQEADYGHFKLLRTTDGETWEQIAMIGTGGNRVDYSFTSEANGVYGTGLNNVGNLFHTVDGGRTWKEVFTNTGCHTQLEIQGLVRDVDCGLSAWHFGSPMVGYAVGTTSDDRNTLVIAKTEDGGASWALSFIQDFGQISTGTGYDYQAVYFKDESTGFVNLGHNRASQPYTTTDGGHTWHGLAASLPGVMKFADPEVGWSLEHGDDVLHYTIDGGRRWTSRAIKFPAGIGGFSLPRRDRAYVVGQHGMIYRYSVVPADYTVAAGIDAPAMPSIESPLDKQVAELAQEVQDLEAAMESMPSGTAGADGGAGKPVDEPEGETVPGAAADEAAGGSGGGGEAAGGEPAAGESLAGTAGSDTGAGSWTEAHYGSRIQKLQATLTAIGNTIPRFGGRFRNLNLIAAGLQLLSDLASRGENLQSAFRALRMAKDPESAKAAMAELFGSAQSLAQTTKSLF